MKKSLLCLIVSMLLALPLLLTSCGDDMTAEEIANANFQEADTALTLSFWLPADNSVLSVDSAVDDNDEIYGGNGFKDTFDKRLVDVEEAFNDYLQSNNYCTKIKFVLFSEEEYYDKLTEKFEQIKEIEKDKGKAYLIANKYVNHAIKNSEDIYEMAYPDILDNQLDIFFVGGYDNYIKYIESGDTQSIDNFFSEGQVYNGLFKMIRQPFFDATKVDGKYYGIPNNHLFAENGQYILVDKALYNEYADSKWEDTFNLYSLQSYIEKIGNNGDLTGVVPFCGDVTNIPGILYLNEANLVAASYQDATIDPNTGKLSFTPEYLTEMTAYKDYMKFYKELESKSFVETSLEANERAAVRLFSGNLVDAGNVNDYYVIETIPAYSSREIMHSSMFAISSHSANYERSMKVLYLLQESVELRTILQYGVEEVDFEYGKINGEDVVNVLDSGYKMNILYTGNCYRTYPESGVPMSYWDGVKELNLKTELHPFSQFMLAWENEDFKSMEDLAALKTYLDSLEEVSQQMKNTFDGMSFSAYKDSSGKNETVVNKRIENATKKLNTAQEAYDSAKAAYDAATNEDEKKTASEQMAKQQLTIDEQQAEIKKWEEIKIVTVLRNNNLTAISEMLALYIKLYNSVK